MSRPPVDMSRARVVMSRPRVVMSRPCTQKSMAVTFFTYHGRDNLRRVRYNLKTKHAFADLK